MSGNTKKNREIREALKAANMFQYQLAEMLGVSEYTLCVWMRKEMAEDQKQECLTAIRNYKDVDGN